MNIIFSHESDIDGLGCIILFKLAFNNIDYILLPNTEKLELTFRKYIESNKLDKYNKIYITDLSLYNPSLDIVANSLLKDKVLIFDHHQKAIDDGMNKYPFTKIIEEDVNGKRSGTDLLYEYLVDNNLIKRNKALDEFVNLTRLEDTWEWKTSGETGIKAHNLATLLNATSKEEYIKIMIKKLSSNPSTFTITKKEQTIIDNKIEEYNNKLKFYIKEIEYFKDNNNDKYGIVYANYEYRNELAEYIKKDGNKESIKYLIVVALDKGDYGQKSYRSIDEEYNVNNIATLHGGGGHPKSASVNITKEQKAKISSLSKKESLLYLAESKYSIE